MDLKAIVLGVIFYIGICAFMFFRQSELLFPSYFAPKSIDPEFKTFTAEDGTKLETKSFAGSKSDDVIVLFTGNAQNSTLVGGIIFKSFDKEISIETINYRSYGNSEGKPNEENLFADSLAFTKHVQKKHAGKKLYLMGVSLGTGVASYISSKIDVDGLILKTPYDSIRNVAKGNYPFLPVDLLLLNPFESVQYLKENKAPIAVIRVELDEVILPERTQAMVEQTKNIVHDHTEAGMRHTQLLNDPYRNKLKNILKVALKALKKHSQ